MQNLKEIDIKLYSTDDVCKLLHIGKQKCLQLFHQEDFPSINIGKRKLITLASYLVWKMNKKRGE